MLLNVLSVNIKSHFKLSPELSNIFLIETAADNYIYNVGSFAIEIRFQSKWLVPILRFIYTTKKRTFARHQLKD